MLVAEDGHLILSDFENATCLRNDASLPPHDDGIPALEEMKYHAPELVLGWEYDYSVDWWSFGLVLYWIFTGKVSSRHARCDGHILTQRPQHAFFSETSVPHLSILRSTIFHSKLPDNPPDMEHSAYQLILRVRHAMDHEASTHSTRPLSASNTMRPFASMVLA